MDTTPATDYPASISGISSTSSSLGIARAHPEPLAAARVGVQSPNPGHMQDQYVHVVQCTLTSGKPTILLLHRKKEEAVCAENTVH